MVSAKSLESASSTRTTSVLLLRWWSSDPMSVATLTVGGAAGGCKSLHEPSNAVDELHTTGSLMELTHGIDTISSLW